MEQRCDLRAVWLTWLGLPLLGVVVGFRSNWITGVGVLLIGILALILYIRWFAYFSRWLGYGSVRDTPAAAAAVAGTGLPRVVLHTANVCPFCPIVRRRLKELQGQMHFELEELDVTFRPEVIRERGLRSVPVIEVSGRTMVGNATSEEIASFVREAAGRTTSTGAR